MRHHLLPVLAAVGAVASPAVALAVRPPIVLADARIEVLGDETAIEARARKAVRVTGGNTSVRIVPTDTSARSLSFGIRHVDDGDHRFEIAFGGTAPGPSKGASNEIAISCNELDGGSAVIMPHFVGVATYSIRVVKDGQLVTDEHGREGAFQIDDFEGGAELRKTETLGVTLAYGVLRADAWTLTVRHEGFTISITPDAAQEFTGLPAVGLRTDGLPQVDLTSVKTRVKI